MHLVRSRIGSIATVSEAYAQEGQRVGQETGFILIGYALPWLRPKIIVTPISAPHLATHHALSSTCETTNTTTTHAGHGTHKTAVAPPLLRHLHLIEGPDPLLQPQLSEFPEARLPFV